MSRVVVWSLLLSLSALAACSCSGKRSAAAGQRDDAGPLDAGRTPDASVSSGPCAQPGEPVDLGPLPAVLHELSGLAASRKNPGVLWAHNDSGGAALLHALRADGSLLATLVLEGAVAVDWEDLAVGPCPAGDCLFVGDIGDNAARRTDASVLRVPEPDLTGVAAGETLRSSEWEPLSFRYAGGAAFDAETLLVNPVSGALFVLTKAWGGSSVAWRFPEPLTPGAQAELVKVADLPEPSSEHFPLTGGDVSPDGDALLLRTYDALLLLRQPEGQGFEAVFTAPATRVPVASEPQGEAVAWRADGTGYLTASEGAGERLHGVACR